MEFQSNTFKNFLKGLIASTDRYNQPQGSFPRGSNLLLSKRGSLVTCDGSQIIHAFNGLPTVGRGKILTTFLFSPTGVAAYYLILAQALDVPIGGPANLTLSDGGAGGGFTGLVYYKVTAMDGVGGETLATVENSINLPAGHKATLTWNIVPNAAYYNVYRSFAPGVEIQVTSLTLPVIQPGTLTASYTDDGIATIPLSLLLTAAGSVVSPDGSQITWTTTIPHNLFAGYTVACTNGGDGRFNGTYLIQSVPTSTSFVTTNPNNVPNGTFAGPGNVIGGNPPVVDGTQQIVLFKMPVLPANLVSLPVAYHNSDIIALFPANLRTTSSPGSGGGGTGGGGTGGSGGTGGGAGGGTGSKGKLPIANAP